MLKFRKLLTRGLAIAAIAAVAGFGAATLGYTPAMAAHGGGHGGGVAHGGGGAHFRGGRGGGRVIVRGGGGRHFWHGRWWGPGVGPCWQWTPLGWVWICG